MLKISLFFRRPPLDILTELSDPDPDQMAPYSTREAAEQLGVSHISLRRYIAAKKIPMPPVVTVGGVRVRLWSDSDIERAREILPTIQNGRKTRYQKVKQQAKKKPAKKKR